MPTKKWFKEYRENRRRRLLAQNLCTDCGSEPISASTSKFASNRPPVLGDNCKAARRDRWRERRENDF